MSNVKRFRWFFPYIFTACNILFSLECFNPCLYLQNIGITNSIQASISVSSLGPQERAPLSHAWPQKLCVTIEKVSTTPVFLYPSDPRT